jgi:hypothetical protein
MSTPAPAPANDMEALCGQLASLIGAFDPAVRGRLLDEVVHRVQAKLAVTAVPVGKPTPEVLEWANGLFTDEEAIAGLREIRETGGFELRDFIHELDLPAAPDERPGQ